MTVLTTSRFAIPYPDGNEDADVPTDLQTLADRVEFLFAKVYDELVPIGTMKIWPQAAAPTNWLLCNGDDTLLRAGTYAALFAVLGTAYGAVDGTHFTLPDLRGRVPVGVDGAAARLTANDTLGASSGEERHTLSSLELPPHVVSIAGASVYSSGSIFGPNNWSAFTNPAQSHNNMQPYQVFNYIIRYA